MNTTTTTVRVLEIFWALALPGEPPESRARYMTQRQVWGRLPEAVRCKSAEAARDLLRGNPELDPDNKAVAVAVYVTSEAGGTVRRLEPQWQLLRAAGR